MIVVSDNSPLQYLILIECIEVLPALYGEVLTTPQVIDELTRLHAPPPVKSWADAPPDWLRVESPTSVRFLNTIDLGEASAISLAQEWCADLLLIDERAGTHIARHVGIEAVGTLGVLIDAAVERLVDFEQALERLVLETSFYASPDLLAAARRLFQHRINQLPKR